jgi:Bacterial Ig-like domain
MGENLSLNVIKENYTKVLLGGALALSLVIVLFMVISNVGNFFPPNAVLVSPKDGVNGVSPFAQVTVTFDRNISVGNQSKLKLDPAVDGQTVVVGKTVTFSPVSYFEVSKKYTVTLTDPEGTWGARGKTVIFSFTVKSNNNLTQDEKNRFQALSSLGLGEEARKAAQNDPLIKKAYAVENFSRTLPYDTNEFSISYIQATSVYVVYIKESPYDTNKQKSIDYIKSQSVDPSWINIEYTSARGVYPGH